MQKKALTLRKKTTYKIFEGVGRECVHPPLTKKGKGQSEKKNSVLEKETKKTQRTKSLEMNSSSSINKNGQEDLKRLCSRRKKKKIGAEKGSQGKPSEG